MNEKALYPMMVIKLFKWRGDRFFKLELGKFE